MADAAVMQYRTLGRTQLRVSAIGLGAGGPSCLGQKTGSTERESVALVQRAIELGINLFDTSPRNGTEQLIGRGIRGQDRDALVLSTKANVSIGEQLVSPTEFAASLDNSLRALGTDHLDIVHFHGVLPQEYDFAVAELLPILEAARKAGKLRFIGLTEHFDRDRGHRMLQRALADDYWDTMMVGFNLINQCARHTVFGAAQQKGVGILGMFALRRALSSVQSLRDNLIALKDRGELPPEGDIERIIDRLQGNPEQQTTLSDSAYRYCRDEPGIHSVLIGTGNVDHLVQNVQTFSGLPLPGATRQFIDDTFSHIRDFSGN